MLQGRHTFVETVLCVMLPSLADLPVPFLLSPFEKIVLASSRAAL